MMSPPPSLCASPVWTTTRFNKGPQDKEGCGSFSLGSALCQNGRLVLSLARICWALLPAQSYLWPEHVGGTHAWGKTSHWLPALDCFIFLFLQSCPGQTHLRTSLSWARQASPEKCSLRRWHHVRIGLWEQFLLAVSKESCLQARASGMQISFFFFRSVSLFSFSILNWLTTNLKAVLFKNGNPLI